MLGGELLSCNDLFDRNILLVIMIHRLHAMYQRSRKMLIFLAVTFLAVSIASVVMVARDSNHLIWGELHSNENSSLSGSDESNNRGSGFP
jgi:hypothetical protein